MHLDRRDIANGMVCMGNRWQKELVRFNVESGPASLFARVRFKMRDVHSVKTNASHFRERLKQRDIPKEVLQAIEQFDSKIWRLVTAEVRTDRGKFYNSTWEYQFAGKRYWLTIGLGNVAETIVEKETSGIEKCIRSGAIYDYVDMVNQKLMVDEKETVSV